MKLKFLFILSGLYILCFNEVCAKAISTQDLAAKKKFTYKKGVLVTHWTGCVAPRYMGVSNVPHTYGASWFDEEDVQWIARKGFDHLQIDVDVQRWFSENEEDNKKNMAIYRNAVQWANKHGLGVVLIFDVHPYGEQPDPADKSVLAERAAQWKKIAAYFFDIKDGLRFHSGDRNIPFATDPNNRYLKYYQAIREIDKNRFFYINIPVDIDNEKAKAYISEPPDASFEHIESLDLSGYDKNVGISFTYFQPEVFIFQKPEQTIKVSFPGTTPDFNNITDDSAYFKGYIEMAKQYSGINISEKEIENDFAVIKKRLSKIAPGREVYLGQFGIRTDLNESSSINYIRAVKNGAEKAGVNWCIYDYESGRAIRNASGEANPAYHGLDLREPN